MDPLTYFPKLCVSQIKRWDAGGVFGRRNAWMGESQEHTFSSENHVSFNHKKASENQYPTHYHEPRFYTKGVCEKQGESKSVFAEYIKQRGYDIHDVQAYGQGVMSHETFFPVMLKDAGFQDVIDEDIIDQFVKSSDVR
ncbi:hypothetical protein Rs2_18756 [Raphanus sativus]|nr:Uncharacterized protein Rs2_47497 [Raphanus sativus]KAJ4904805.1 hypothetical protein Rs2_18756 [Raphanus sativus]